MPLPRLLYDNNLDFVSDAKVKVLIMMFNFIPSSQTPVTPKTLGFAIGPRITVQVLWKETPLLPPTSRELKPTTYFRLLTEGSTGPSTSDGNFGQSAAAMSVRGALREDATSSTNHS
ncbi:hypothetical protein M426DRAFT_11294 [Hypoxylon sp. CI-4A]|nr:hypothetical protein M426DRAFT_11294 [Hypoxylon sp. CI-4A]